MRRRSKRRKMVHGRGRGRVMFVVTWFYLVSYNGGLQAYSPIDYNDLY
jgi:hypothetical protein